MVIRTGPEGTGAFQPNETVQYDYVTGSELPGSNGDGASGIDLRRGVFRRRALDEDVAKVITTGIADAGMPSFKFQPAEVGAVIPSGSGAAVRTTCARTATRRSPTTDPGVA